MKAWLTALLLSLCLTTIAAETRFDAHYFFQSETELQEKAIKAEDLARFSRQFQAQVYKLLKKNKLSPASGYVVVAMREDGQAAAWLDMQPALHEYYAQQIDEIVQKIAPFQVKKGIVVFAIKMAIDTPVHTKKTIPEPAEFTEARKKLNANADIEELVYSIWPE